MSEANYSTWFAIYCSMRRNSHYQIDVGPKTSIDSIRYHISKETGLLEEETQVMVEDVVLDPKKLVQDYSQLQDGTFIWYRRISRIN